MKRTIMTLCLLCGSLTLAAKDYVISTANTSLILRTDPGKRVDFVYYGSRVESAADVYGSGTAVNWNAYPVFGTNSTAEHALAVTHADGDVSLELATEEVKEYTDSDGGRVVEFDLKDKVYPFYVKLFYKTYDDCDVVKTWTEFSHTEKKDVLLNKFASAYIPTLPGNHWISYMAGAHACECQLYEEPLNRGRKVLGNHDGTRNAFATNPAFMISESKPSENEGNVLGGALAWTGNCEISFMKNYSHGRLEITAGISPELSQYHLQPKEVFTTPELILTYSTEGKGGVSRNFHRWARKHQIIGGTELRDILLNSWEGVYFNVSQEGMDRMMKDFSEIGGELFVMDDGWFGDKYPRDNGSTSLGDWMVCEKKLPGGVSGLIDTAEKEGLKFGIWIEPEFVNSTSELYEAHPDWVIRQPEREPVPGRGGTQLVLDLCNPKVQEHVFQVVDNLMQANPRIYFMKWDANASINNASSLYLPKDRQSHLYIEYHRGLQKVCQRIRAKYPDLIIQLCASGGGRLGYGFFPYFNENWTSDNTDAVQRLFIQWGETHFYPANVMAAHVSASPNHQTRHVVPLKFRFDVAMTGRLGMEMKPSDFTPAEKEFAKRAIETYKSIRPVIQQGDLYRILSPYDKDNHCVSMAYVTPGKERAVFFAFRPHFLVGMYDLPFKVAGLDPARNYRIKELNAEDPAKPVALDGKVISGKYLMEHGITVEMARGDLKSVVLELIAE